MVQDIDPEPKDVMSWLRKTLRLLASPATVQIGSQPRGMSAADEMALDFDAAWLTRWAAIEAGYIGPHQERAIQDVDDVLDRMSGPEHPEFWTDDALQSSVHWAAVRRLATQALELLDPDKGDNAGLQS